MDTQVDAVDGPAKQTRCLSCCGYCCWQNLINVCGYDVWLIACELHIKPTDFVAFAELIKS